MPGPFAIKKCYDTNMRKTLLVWLVAAAALFLPLKADAAPVIHLISRPDCPNCRNEKAFLADLAKTESFTIDEHDLTTTQGQADWATYKAQYDIKLAVTPITIIDGQVIIGFNQASDSGEEIKKALHGEKIAGITGKVCEDTSQVCAPSPKWVTLPFFGKVDLNSWSLWGVTAAVGLADGYNPCAMWSFVALLSFLVALGSRRKMLIVGGAFLLTSFLASWIYLLGWHGLFTWAFGWQKLTNVAWFIPATKGMLGILSLIMAWRFVQEWRKNPDECEVTSPKTRSRIVRALQRIAEHESLLFATLGACVLALVVNVIEFLCSLGLPVVYTSVLAERAVPTAQAVGYITLYNVFYMADDLLVFAVVMITARTWMANWRGARWVKLGAAILLAWAAWSFIAPLL